MSYKPPVSNRKRRRTWKKKRPHRINEEIKVKEVRLIDDEKNYLGIVSPTEALQVAREKGFDLVEVSPKASPPVCKLLDYGKFLYQLQKEEQKNKKKQKKIHLKEIKFTPVIEEHDIQTKLRQIQKFLEHGDKVKITIWLRGRQKRKPEMLGEMTEKIFNILKEMADIETEPKKERFSAQFMIKAKKGGSREQDKDS